MKLNFLKYQGQTAMRKSTLLAALALTLFSFSVQAQIYTEFDPPTRKGNRPYTPLPTAGSTVYSASQFTVPPNVDPDDGFTSAQLPFPFEYNGTVYNWILINVNGFIMMSTDGQIPIGVVGQQVQTRLFDGSQFPRNVVAPFWGDHFFRTNEVGYTASSVLSGVATVNGRTAFCVEWKNLNINDKSLPASVGNFQVYLYKQDNVPNNYQGDIEFAYGQIGNNAGNVVTRNASVGIKGSTPQGDWLNAFYTQNTPSYRSTQLSVSWQPSGGSDTIIVFAAKPRLRLNVWGDGDADFSQAAGSRHYSLPQNQYVTANDALVILRSVATNKPLDSLVKRMAFKGDVDHNGRFYYSTRNQSNTADTALYRREVRFRTAMPRPDLTLNEHFTSLASASAQDSLLRLQTFNMPSDNSLDYGSIYFQVNAYDAALIMHYLGGRVITLPWTLDTIVPFGKTVGMNEAASNVAFDNVTRNADGTVRVPVYLNGNRNGAVSAVFNVNGEIVSVENALLNVVSVFDGSKVAIAGSVKADASEPIAYVNVRTNAQELQFNNVEFNGDARQNQSVSINSLTNESNSLIAVGAPNPAFNSNTVSVTIPANGTYSLKVYDILGNEVNTLANSTFSKGSYSFTWEGRTAAGAIAPAGVYFYKLVGEGVNAINTVVIQK